MFIVNALAALSLVVTCSAVAYFHWHERGKIMGAALAALAAFTILLGIGSAVSAVLWLMFTPMQDNMLEYLGVGLLAGSALLWRWAAAE